MSNQITISQSQTPRRTVVIDSDGKSAHTESPVDIELEETDIM